MLAAVARGLRRKQCALGSGFNKLGARNCSGPTYGNYIPEYISPHNGAPRLPSPWNKWFPYEQVPCTPRFLPYAVYCEEKQIYMFDTSGESTTQPWEEYPGFCKERGFTPIPYQPRHTGWKLLCACKHSPTRPLADLTFVLHWMDYNMPQAIAASFGSAFVVGLFLTWFMHP